MPWIENPKCAHSPRQFADLQSTLRIPHGPGWAIGPRSLPCRPASAALPRVSCPTRWSIASRSKFRDRGPRWEGGEPPTSLRLRARRPSHNRDPFFREAAFGFEPLMAAVPASVLVATYAAHPKRFAAFGRPAFRRVFNGSCFNPPKILPPRTPSAPPPSRLAHTAAFA